MTISKGPNAPVYLEINEQRTELTLELQNITLPKKHQTWGSFAGLAWGKFKSLQWGRF